MEGMLTHCSGVTWHEWSHLSEDEEGWHLTWQVCRIQMQLNPRVQFCWGLSSAPSGSPGFPSHCCCGWGLWLTPSPVGCGHRLVGPVTDVTLQTHLQSPWRTRPRYLTWPRPSKSSWHPVKWQSRHRPPGTTWRRLTLWCCGVFVVFLSFYYCGTIDIS